jgi:hypothetical protein
MGLINVLFVNYLIIIKLIALLKEDFWWSGEIEL